MVKSISEILTEANSQKKVEDRAEVLRKNNSDVLQGMLKIAFDPRIEWDIPSGAPPYTPSILKDNQALIYTEFPRFYVYLRGGAPGLLQVKRETIFVQMLESISADDATLVLAVKDKKVSDLFGRINEKVVEAAFPGLLAA